MKYLHLPTDVIYKCEEIIIYTAYFDAYKVKQGYIIYF